MLHLWYIESMYLGPAFFWSPASYCLPHSWQTQLFFDRFGRGILFVENQNHATWQRLLVGGMKTYLPWKLTAGTWKFPLKQEKHRLPNHQILACFWGVILYCTSWYGKYPIIFRVLYIPAGCLGFLNHLPSIFVIFKFTRENPTTSVSPTINDQPTALNALDLSKAIAEDLEDGDGLLQLGDLGDLLQLWREGRGLFFTGWWNFKYVVFQFFTTWGRWTYFDSIF